MLEFMICYTNSYFIKQSYTIQRTSVTLYYGKMYSPSSEDDSSELDSDWLSISERGEVTRISGISIATYFGSSFV